MYDTSSTLALEEHGTRMLKPLPKRRRILNAGSHATSLPYPPITAQQTSNGAADPTSTTTNHPDRGWSVTANFPGIDKGMNMTREQFIAHANELAKGLQHHLQGGRLPSVTGDRLEFVQAFLQQHRDQAAGLSSTSAKSPSSDANVPPPSEESTTYSVSVPLPPLSPDSKFDLEAVFSAQLKASLANAAGNLGAFDDCDALTESWEEVAEFCYSHRLAPPPPPIPHDLLTEVTSDLGRRGLRDGEDDEEEEGEDGHLRQPGNTKKRKTPANANNNWHSQTRGDVDDAGIDDDHGGYAGSGGDAGRLEQRGRGESEGGGGGGQQGADKGVQGSGGSGGVRGGGSDDRGMGKIHGPRSAKSLGRLPLSTLSSFAVTSPSSARVGQLKAIVRARGKLAGAMVAGVQHKEMLKARKRQLEAVLGVLSSNSNSTIPSNEDGTLNSLALDKALAMVGTSPLPTIESAKPLSDKPTSNPSVGTGRQVATLGVARQDGRTVSGPPVRPSKRIGARRARVLPRVEPQSAAPTLPVAEFTFKCDSIAKERTKAAQEEAAKLRQRFEAELERQAANAAKLAATSRAANAKDAAMSRGAGSNNGGSAKGTKQKKTKTSASPSKSRVNNSTHVSNSVAPTLNGVPQQQAPQQRSTTRSSQKENANPQQQPAHVPPPVTPTNKPKKKKRSAMANASNPHHLRNYVPSRLPHSGETHGQGHIGLSGLLGPLPVRFLTAELPPRRGSPNAASPTPSVAPAGGGGKKNTKGGPTAPSASVIQPPGTTDEWICMFCEYDLYYGDEQAFRRAVRNRKKILKRRRRARERAAAAANGVKSYGKAQAPGQAPPPPAGVPPPVNGAEAAGQSEGEEDYELEEDYDGDPGYEEGSSGNQVHDTVAAGGGRGMEGHGTGKQRIADSVG